MAFIGLLGAAAFFLSQSLVDRQYATKTKRNASIRRTRTTRKIHFSSRFINRRFKISCGFRSWTKSSTDSSLRLVRRDRLQPLKEKPETYDQLEQSQIGRASCRERV